jgi:hypothetical protein
MPSEPFRPLSARGQSVEAFEGLQPGIPPYLAEPVRAWVEERMYYQGRIKEGLLNTLQVTLRLDEPLNWQNGKQSALRSLLRRVQAEDDFALDVLDFLLGFQAGKEASGRLNTHLRLGGSEWEVTARPDDDPLGYQLTKRSLGPVKESIEELRTDSQRAHHHLMSAWNALSGRNPNPSTAYREAVRAIEAVAKPVVSPKNPKATLGTMIKDLQVKPEKWEVVLDSASASDVADMAAMVWTSQLDRHGTDDEEVPLTVSQQEADTAVHIAVALVRLFAGGLIHPV